jgi:hypothetical protein
LKQQGYYIFLVFFRAASSFGNALYEVFFCCFSCASFLQWCAKKSLSSLSMMHALAPLPAMATGSAVSYSASVAAMAFSLM